MKKTSYYIFISLILIPGMVFALNPSPKEHEEIRDFIKSIFKDNAAYVADLSHSHLKSYADEQSPRATVVACSDSRVQSDAFHTSPVNDLFFVRNIGNQIKTTEGSVEYGINHLHTPVLLIIGHSHCGAIKAALGDYSSESPAIQRELDSLRLKKATEVDTGVIENVHNQVKYALQRFKDKMDKHELIIIGAVYDFRNDFNHGYGRLILINLNGEGNPDIIKQHIYIKDLEDIAIGHK
jgi:carbonic anhydrase